MIIKRIDQDFDSLFIINQSPSSARSLKYKLYPEMEGSHTTYGQQGVWYSDLPSDPGNVGAQTNLGNSNNQTFWLKYNMGNGTNVVMPTTSNFTVGHVNNATTVSGFTNQNNAEYVAYLWASDDSSSSMIKWIMFTLYVIMCLLESSMCPSVNISASRKGWQLLLNIDMHSSNCEI